MNSTVLHTVLTGDVIGSSKLSERDRARLVDELYEAYEHVRDVAGLDSTTAFEVFRGDSWQLYSSEPTTGLHLALAFRAQFRFLSSVDTRIAIAVNTVKRLDLDRVSQSNGPAFTDSGHGLDSLNRRTLSCWLPFGHSDTTRQRLFSTIASASGAFASEWTPSQAQAVALTLTLPTSTSDQHANQKQVAAAWRPKPVRQQTVSEHLVKAHWDELSEYLDVYESEVIDLDVERQFGPQS